MFQLSISNLQFSMIFQLAFSNATMGMERIYL